VTAREELYAAVMSGGYHSPDRSEKASAIIDAFAHELAEKIRNSEWLHEYTDGHMSDCNQAADEIDPEA
jgi:hypothetical protein